MKRICYVFLFILLFFSCSSDNDDNFFVETSNFYALTVGNSWVYKNFKYNNQTQAYDETGVVDSVTIVGTENIAGEIFYKFRRFTTGNASGIALCNPDGEYFEYLRDSLGYLIREDGTIKYANNDFSPRVSTSEIWGTVYDQLIAQDHEITVEAGTFMSTYSQRYAILNDSQQSAGLDHFYYVDGVGLVYNTSSFVTQDIPEISRRLESYIIE